MKKSTKKTIVAFKIGRGGRYHNSGHKTYIGELDFQDLQGRNDTDIFIQNRDEQGRFCRPFICDESGSTVSEDNPRGGIGTLNFDGEYDTQYCKYIEDCTEDELILIAEDNNYWKAPEIEEYLQCQDLI